MDRLRTTPRQTLETISERLRQAETVFEFATGLGRTCLERGKEMVEVLAEENAEREKMRLELAVGETDLELWEAAVEKESLEGLAGDDLLALGERLRADHPLDFLAVLRGLCRRALPQLYVETRERIVLDRGSPVRFAGRPVHRIFEVATPRQETLQNGQLLEGLGFSLFNHAAGDEVGVTLDFGPGRRLDELTWIEGEQPRLPRIATLHPYGDGGYTFAELGSEGFFSVRPRAWDPGRVLELLAAAKTRAEIALMPELSMPSADALEAALAADPGAYPPLVIAGSAHETLADGTRVNESRIYVDGVKVGRHRKIHPFLATVPEGGSEKVREAITHTPGEITLLSGERTRLAVAICADLDDKRISALLVEAGANLLLVPSFTDAQGAFNGAICNLASNCQGVAVIANSQLGKGAEQRFRVAVAVPRAALGKQSAEYGPDGERPLAEAALFDPNLELREALRWD